MGAYYQMMKISEMSLAISGEEKFVLIKTL